MTKDFDASELEDFSKKLLAMANTTMPNEVKAFLRKEGGVFKKDTKSLANSKINKRSGNYLKGIKKGRAYLYEPDKAYTIRVYNSQPHAHLIESGHKSDKAKSGFVEGYKIMAEASKQFESKFNSDMEHLIDDLLNKGLK